MRDYAKVAPTFWMRGSGRKLRGDADGIVVAMYLLTCPAANMVGLYYVPLVSIAHETGLGEKRLREALERLSTAEFAYYDEEAELAWVPNMAAYQIGDIMKPGDNRRAAVLAELGKLRGHRFVCAFWKVYGVPYSLGPAPKVAVATPPVAAPAKPLPSPSEGAPEGHQTANEPPPKGKDEDREEKRRAGAGEREEEEQEITTTRGRERARVPLGDFGMLTTPDDELPDSWTPNDGHAALAQQLGLKLDEELGLYRARRKRDAFRCGNWDADFEGWLRTGAKLAREQSKRRGGRTTPVQGAPAGYDPFEGARKTKEEGKKAS